MIFQALHALAALAATLLALYAGAWAWKRWGTRLAKPLQGSSAPKNLEILEKLPLNATTTLYLVRHGPKTHLLALGNHPPMLLPSPTEAPQTTPKATHKKAPR